MDIKKGLSIDGLNYFSDLVSTKKKPDLMKVGVEIGKMTGHYEIVNFLSGYKDMEQFLFRVPKWPIGGMYFDGVMRTEHISRVRPTNYPVQTGVTMTDHAIIEPAEVTVEIMMTDAKADSYLQTPPAIGNILKTVGTMYSNFAGLPCMPTMVTTPGEGRSIDAWKSLRALQMARVPITVETRLQTYHNMLIEELSAPDDVNTLHALRCTVRMREIIFATVAETAVSARASASAGESASGQTPVQTGDDVNKTAARVIKDAGGSIFT